MLNFDFYEFSCFEDSDAGNKIDSFSIKWFAKIWKLLSGKFIKEIKRVYIDR